MFIIFIIALWPLLTQGDNQNDKSLIFPISIHNDVPFITISSLCPENSYSEIEVMLDTGSEELWLGDKACKSCSKTGTFCPHLNTITTRIKYFKGEIGGSESFLSLCGQQYKFLCVKQIDRQLSLKYGHGIMGLRVNSVGNKFIKKSLYEMKAFESKQLQYIFYIERNSNYLMFGYHSEFLGNTFFEEIQCDPSWIFKADALSFSSSALQTQLSIPLEKYQIAVDTGSSHLAFPQQICSQLQKQLLDQSGIKCTLGQSIYCSRRINLSIHLRLHTFSELVINSKAIVDEDTSGIKIACLGQNKEKKILYGYPFFESYGIGFVPEKSIVRVYEYRHKQGQSSSTYSRIFFILYCSILGLCCYFVQLIINTIQQKRSIKIII